MQKILQSDERRKLRYPSIGSHPSPLRHENGEGMRVRKKALRN
ncbi:MAG: hypothetical protein OEW75_06980 [Cyclobacteriaceae bacterium]|nr:hypothetical protein [Cyclobacteriaceae bacterium]